MEAGGRLAVVVAFGLLSAGCLGFGTGGEPTVTVTPAPVPTDPAPAGTPAAPDPDGEEVPAFVRGHDRVLAALDHRFERTVTVTGPNGSFRLRVVRLVQAGGPSLGRLQVATDGRAPVESPVRNWTRWRAGGTIWSRTTTAAGRRYVSELLATDTDSFSTGTALPRTVFAGETGVWSRYGDRAVFTSTPALDGEYVDITYVNTGRPRNTSARAVLAEAGYIRNLTVTYDAPVGGTDARIRIEQTVTVGSVAVERPAWVPRDANAGETAQAVPATPR